MDSQAAAINARRLFSRFDKLDVVVMFFIHVARIVDTLISGKTP
jgi:hypothetical protein